MIRAVIFDLDGTLIDSEPNYYASDRLFFREYGIDFTDELNAEFIGVGARDMLTQFKARYALADPVHVLLERKDRRYLERAIGNTVIFPEMKTLLESLHSRGVLMAVASGSSSAVLGTLLPSLGLDEYFKAVVSSCGMERGKPHPDVFLEAARLLNAEPVTCIVFEDSKFGVLAAKRAGMRVVGIPTIRDGRTEEDFRSADLLFPRGMEEFTALKALEWMDSVP